jgi:hypothetical protein
MLFTLTRCFRSCTVFEDMLAVIAIARPAVNTVEATHLPLTGSMAVPIIRTASGLDCTANACLGTDR